MTRSLGKELKFIIKLFLIIKNLKFNLKPKKNETQKNKQTNKKHKKQKQQKKNMKKKQNASNRIKTHFKFYSIKF